MSNTIEIVLIHALLTFAAGCGGVPDSVRVYAAELPARADGQYGLLDEPIRKQLVMKDSLLQCKIDLEDGKKEEDSAACQCSKSSSADWSADCKSWLGVHTPEPEPAEAPPPAPPVAPAPEAVPVAPQPG